MTHNKNTKLIYACTALSFLLITILLAVLADIRFETFKLNEHKDMGYFNQLFYVLSGNTQSLISISPHGMSNPHIAAHFFPIMYILTPIYMIFPYIQTLFIIQIIFMLAGTFAVYNISLHLKSNRLTAVTLSVFYIINPYAVSYIFNDFRFLHLGIPMILFAYLFYLKKKLLPFLCFMTAAFLCREELAFVFPFFPLLTPRTDEKNNFLWTTAPAAASIFWYVICYRFIFIRQIAEGHLISPYITTSWILSWQNHSSFIKESIAVFAKDFWHFQIIFIIFILRKPATLFIIYPFAFLGAIYDNPIKNFSNPHWFSSIHYTAIPFVFAFIAFLLFFAVNQKKYKQSLLFILIIFASITSIKDIRFNIFTDEEVSKKEEQTIKQYIYSNILTPEKNEVVLADPFFAPILSQRSNTFLTDSIPNSYPNLEQYMSNINYIFIHKENMFPELKHSIERHPHSLTETETHYLIKMDKPFNLNPFLSEPDSHRTIYK